MHNALYKHNHNPASCRNPRPHIVHCTFGHNSALLYAITRSPRTKTLTFLHLLIWPLNKRARQTLRHQSDDHLSFDGKKSRMNWCCCASIYDTPPHTQPIVWWIQVVLTSWCRWAMLEEATYPTRYGRACDVETRTENTITGLRSVQRSTARYYKGLAKLWLWNMHPKASQWSTDGRPGDASVRMHKKIAEHVQRGSRVTIKLTSRSPAYRPDNV